MMQFDGAFAMEYSCRVARKRVLFENSIVCLVVLFCCCFWLHSDFPCWGVVFLFLMPVFWCFFASGQVFLIRLLPCLLVGGFCLESLILAQDERWRRA
jgi:hypothetical protein